MGRVSLEEAVFASNSKTEIPQYPVSGITYRNEEITREDIEKGWPFNTVCESSTFNHFMFKLTSLLKEIEQTGVLRWSDKINYNVGSFCTDEEGKLKRCISVNGPDSLLVNPVDDIENLYWEEFKADVSEENTGGGKSIGEIFAYPSCRPPKGAYILNGQIIYNCEEIYPQFWQWLQNEAKEGEIDVPVYKSWTMPLLTADGILGGQEYAAAVEPLHNENLDDSEPTIFKPAYNSFDGELPIRAAGCELRNTNKGSLIFYSPVKLKFSKLTLRTSNSSVQQDQMMESCQVLVSNDNEYWVPVAAKDKLYNASGVTEEITLSSAVYDANNVGYQYLKIIGIAHSEDEYADEIVFHEISIHAEEYSHSDKEFLEPYLKVVDFQTYEDIVREYDYCGAFAVWDGNVRLPRYTSAFLMGSDSSNIGETVAAGLPQIPDHKHQYVDYFSRTGAGVGGTAGTIYSDSETRTTRSTNLDDIVDDIYGKSDTVQPAAVPVSWCIQVFNTATELSEMQSAELASQIQTKAEIDLANTSINIDFVVESWNDDEGNWYRLYRSGWLEQGGVAGDGSSSSYPKMTITLPKPFAGTNYNVQVTGKYTEESASGACYCYNRTSETISLVLVRYGVDWYACGYSR